MRSIIRNREQGHAVNQNEGQDAMDVAADEDQDQHFSGENLSDVEAAEITILKKKLHATQKANWRLRQEKTSLKTALEVHKVRNVYIFWIINKTFGISISSCCKFIHII